MSGEALGNLRVARVRDDADAVPRIAEITGLSPLTVRDRLSTTHGMALIRNAFIDAWPSHPDRLGSLRVKQARDWGLIPEIAYVTKLTERRVQGRLEKAHGRSAVCRVFAADWPQAQEAEDELDEGTDPDDDVFVGNMTTADWTRAREPKQEPDEDADSGNDVVLGSMTAAQVQDDRDAHHRIAMLTVQSESVVRQRLDRATHPVWGRGGKALVRDIFSSEWPSRAETLGNLRIREIRQFGLFSEIADILGWTEAEVRRAVGRADGRISAFTAFEAVWPASEVDRDADNDAAALAEPDVLDEIEDGDADSAEETLRGTCLHPDELEIEGAETSASIYPDVTGIWSRPRSLLGVMEALGLDVPQRLRTLRFQALLQQLEQIGIEMCLVGTVDPLPLDAASPGIAAQVCLRVVDSPEKSKSSAPSRSQKADVAPPVVVVRAQPRAPRPFAPSSLDSDYELALLRLQFLTAVPSMSRQHERGWPDDFLAAATLGLNVSTVEARLLRTVAAGFVRGGHHPSPSIGGLVRADGHHDFDALLARFEDLNPHNPDFTSEILRWVDEVRGRSRPERTKPTPIAAKISGATPAQVHHPVPTSTMAIEDGGHVIVRSLGALDDMFKN